MTPQTKTFTMTDQTFTAVSAELQNQQIHLVGDNGTVQKDGATIQYDIAHNEDGTVVITLTIQRTVVSANFVWGLIQKSLNQVQQSQQQAQTAGSSTSEPS